MQSVTTSTKDSADGQIANYDKNNHDSTAPIRQTIEREFVQFSDVRILILP